MELSCAWVRCTYGWCYLSVAMADQDLGVAGWTHSLDHLEDTLANTGLTNLVVSPHQF